MTNKLINFFINSLLITIFFYIFIYSKTVKETIVYGINIWLYNLIPSLFPFLLLSKLLITYHIFDKLNNYLGKIIESIFNISKNSSFAILISMFTGFPTGSIYTKELLNTKQISIEEANKLIMFTSFANPIFVISFIGETLLNNKKIGIYIFIIHIISGLLIGFIYKVKKSNYIKDNNTATNNNFINNLIKSSNESFTTLLNILGIFIFFLIITSLINTFILNNKLSVLLSSILEITTGLINLSKLNINLRLKISLIGAIISFNGLSVHSQIKSIIDNTPIKYKNYFYARILHSILCFLLIYLFYYFV